MQEKDGGKSKVLEMEEQKGSSCGQAGKEITFWQKSKPNHYSVSSVHNVFVIPPPIMFSKKLDFSTPISPSNE